MKSILLLLVTLSTVFLMAGCGQSPSLQPSSPPQKSAPAASIPAPAPPSSGSVVTAPVDYIATSIQAGENSRGKIETITVQKAIESYQQQEGRNPESLEELHQKKYLPTLPRPPMGHEFKYDAATGTFSIVPIAKPAERTE